MLNQQEASVHQQPQPKQVNGRSAVGTGGASTFTSR